jgi:hypothetical protein
VAAELLLWAARKAAAELLHCALLPHALYSLAPLEHCSVYKKIKHITI